MGEKELRLIEEQFSKANITVLCIASSICIKGYEPNKIKETAELIERGKKIGAKGIRIFLGNFARRFDTKLDVLNHDGIVKSLREICDIDEGFEVMVETPEGLTIHTHFFGFCGYNDAYNRVKKHKIFIYYMKEIL